MILYAKDLRVPVVIERGLRKWRWELGPPCPRQSSLLNLDEDGFRAPKSSVVDLSSITSFNSVLIVERFAVQSFTTGNFWYLPPCPRN